MHVCMCACMYVRMYVCTHVGMDIRIYVYIHTYACMYNTYIHTYIRMHVCVYACIYVCIYIRIRIYIHMYVSVCVSLYVCMYTYTYTRMHRTVQAQVRGAGGGLETCESMEEGVRDLRMIEATRISSGARSGLVAREAAQLNVGHKDSEANLKSQDKVGTKTLIQISKVSAQVYFLGKATDKKN